MDGVDVRRRVQHEQVAEAARSIPRDPVDWSESEHVVDERLVTGFAVAVRARDKKRVRFAGRLQPTYTYQSRDGYALAAIKTRHVFLGGEPRHDKRVEDTYLVSPLRTWGGRPPIDVTVRSSTSWSFQPEDPDGRRRARKGASCPGSRRRPNGRDASCTRSRFRPLVPLRRAVRGRRSRARGRRAALPRRSRGRSGPLAHRVDRLRGLRGEDAPELHDCPRAQIATPGVFIFIPSLSAGLGVPVQVHRRGRPGSARGRRSGSRSRSSRSSSRWTSTSTTEHAVSSPS